MTQRFINKIYYILLTCSALGLSHHPDLSSLLSWSVEYCTLSSSLLPPYWLSSPAYPDKVCSGWAAIWLGSNVPVCQAASCFPCLSAWLLSCLLLLACLLSLTVATKNVTAQLILIRCVLAGQQSGWAAMFPCVRLLAAFHACQPGF